MLKMFAAAVMVAFGSVAFAAEKAWDEDESKEKALDLVLKGFSDVQSGIGMGAMSVNGQTAFGIDTRYAVTENGAIAIKSNFATNGEDNAVGVGVVFSF